ASGGNFGQVYFVDASPQTIDGAGGGANAGTVLLGASAANGLLCLGGAKVTLGANLTVTGASGKVNTTSVPFDIQGTVVADPTAMGLGQVSGTIILNTDGATGWTNHGTIVAQNGGTIRAQGTVGNFT